MTSRKGNMVTQITNYENALEYGLLHLSTEGPVPWTLAKSFAEAPKPSFLESDLMRALRWAWLRFKLDGDADSFFSFLRAVAEDISGCWPLLRATANRWETPYEELGHQYAVVSVAVLCAICGADDVARQSLPDLILGDASRTRETHPETWHQYSFGLAGVLIGGLLGDWSFADEQYRIHSQFKPTGMRYSVNKALLPALLARDAKRLRTALQSSCKHFWRRAENVGALTKESEGVYVYDYAQAARSMATELWPWNELAVVRLAEKVGVQIQFDNFFLPQSLIGHGRSPHGGKRVGNWRD